MRAAPAFRERLCDFEAVNTGSFQQPRAAVRKRPVLEQ
ncbi:hypothetical protein BCR59_19475 [Klebsiella pneumoniae]|nr:hypothetical protein BCR59_19475 [Klebsiella pneumoniae]